MKKTLLLTLSILLPAIISLWSCDDKPAGGEEDLPPVAATGIELDKPTLQLANGYTTSLVATVLPRDADQAVVWISSDTDVATVNAGSVTGVATGKATITAISVDGGFPAECEVSVFPAFSLNKALIYLRVGDKETLMSVIVPEDNPLNNQPVTWKSNDTSVATVSNSGVVTAVAEGTTDIVASVGENTAKCTVTVNWIGKTTFRTSTVWTLGDQIWSDVVMAEGCDKETYTGGLQQTDQRYSDCRNNIRDGVEYGHLYTWLFVNEYGDQLCPDGWRVPTIEDYLALDVELGGPGNYEETGSIRNSDLYDAYVNRWGGEMGGYVYFMNVWPNTRGTDALYWSATAKDATYAYTCEFWIYQGHKCVHIGRGLNYSNGLPVRCVKG